MHTKAVTLVSSDPLKKRHNTAESDGRKNCCRISDFLSLHLSSCQTISNQSEVSTADIRCLVLIWFCDDLKFKVSSWKIIRLLNIWTWYLIIFHHVFTDLWLTRTSVYKNTLLIKDAFFLFAKWPYLEETVDLLANVSYFQTDSLLSSIQSKSLNFTVHLNWSPDVLESLLVQLTTLLLLWSDSSIKNATCRDFRLWYPAVDTSAECDTDN